jgi:hypothetical protein
MPAITPFFQAFGPLLFGRPRREAVAKARQARSLGELYELFGEMLPDRLLAMNEKGLNSRDRVFSPKVTFWAFVSQVLDVGSSCRDVVRKVEAWWRWAHKERRDEPAVSPSAYCQARARLEVQTLRLIQGHLAWSLERRETRGQLWLGRRVKITDGTTLSMPDTAANQHCWPQSTSQQEGLGFPCMKLVGVFSLASGALEHHATGTLHEHESMLFRSLWEKLEPQDVILADRGFCSYATLARLSQRGIDSVMRLHQMRKDNFRSGKRLGPDDRLVCWSKPAQPTTGWTQEQWESLPEKLSLRLIRLRVSTPGFRTREVVLITTLSDAETYPADEIRALYGRRWAVELHFHQIKILLGLDILRCKSPELIERETLLHLIAYNLIRLLMQEAASTHAVELSRISFKGTLDTVRHFATAIHAARATPRRQEALIEEMLAMIASDPVTERPGRSEPRAKKRRAKNYHLLTKPRAEMIAPAHRNRPRPIVQKAA